MLRPVKRTSARNPRREAAGGFNGLKKLSKWLFFQDRYSGWLLWLKVGALTFSKYLIRGHPWPADNAA